MPGRPPYEVVRPGSNPPQYATFRQNLRFRASGVSGEPSRTTIWVVSPQQTTNGHKRLRKMFGRIHEVAEMPNLIEVQKQSYDQFLMVEEPEGGRQDEG